MLFDWRSLPVSSDIAAQYAAGKRLVTAQSTRFETERSGQPYSRLDFVCARLLLAVVPFFFAGCLVGPDYTRPSLPAMQKQFFASLNLPSSADDVGEQVEVSTLPIGEHDRWWEQLDDSRLIVLIEHAVTNSMSLREAYYRVCEARSRRDAVALAPWPQLGVTGAFRRRSSRSQISPANSGVAPSTSQPFDVFSTGVNATWELDVWGRLRRSIEAEDNRWVGSVEDVRDVLVTLVSDVAVNYIDLRVLQMRLRISRANLKLQQRSLALATDRFDAGLVGALDVKQAEAILKSTQATVPALEEQISMRLHRLAVLLGTVPSRDLRDWIGEGPIPEYPGVIAAGVPCELVGQRPDLRSNERAMRAASAEIGVAVGNLYPNISLVGDLAWDATDFSQVFNNQTFFSAGPSVRWNILTLGRTRRNIDIRRSQFQQTVYRFRESLLMAVEEVENGLVGIRRASERVKALDQAALAAEDALNISQETYEIGEANFQRVLDAQRQLLQTQDSLLNARGDVVRNFVLTYRALGGGWRSFEFIGPGSCANGIPCDEPLGLRFLPLASLPPMPDESGDGCAVGSPASVDGNNHSADESFSIRDVFSGTGTGAVPVPRDADHELPAELQPARTKNPFESMPGETSAIVEKQAVEASESNQFATESTNANEPTDNSWYDEKPVDVLNRKIEIPSSLLPDATSPHRLPKTKRSRMGLPVVETPARIPATGNEFSVTDSANERLSNPPSADSVADTNSFIDSVRAMPSVNQPFEPDDESETPMPVDPSQIVIAPMRRPKNLKPPEFVESPPEDKSQAMPPELVREETIRQGALPAPPEAMAEPLLQESNDVESPEDERSLNDERSSDDPELREESDSFPQSDKHRIIILDGPSAANARKSRSSKRKISTTPFGHSGAVPLQVFRPTSSRKYLSRTLSGFGHVGRVQDRADDHAEELLVRQRKGGSKTPKSAQQRSLQFGHSGPATSSSVPSMTLPATTNSENGNSETAADVNPFEQINQSQTARSAPSQAQKAKSGEASNEKQKVKPKAKTSVYPPTADLEEALRPPFNIIVPDDDSE